MNNSDKATLFDIQTLSTHDGPGIRTTVFFKGCPLRCTWCSNPEGQFAGPQLRFYKNRCKGCFACALACPDKRISRSEGYPAFNRSLCRFCRTFECVETCPYEAVNIAGYELTADQLMESLKKDIRLFRNSGGGITFSGGEPLIYADFLKILCEKLQSIGINTAIETSGYAETNTVLDMFSLIDTIFYDVKHMDPDKHFEFTGVSNTLILENLRQAAGLFRERITVSIPVIPGFNDTIDEISSIGSFLVQTGIKKARLLPYHSMGIGKYESLGIDYPHRILDKSLKPGLIDEFKEILVNKGIDEIV